MKSICKILHTVFSFCDTGNFVDDVANKLYNFTMTKQEFDNIIEAIGIRADDGLYEAVNAALNSLDVLDEFDGDTQ